MSEIITLPERLGFDATRELHKMFVQHRGVPLHVDGSNVNSAGALASQVLLSAARTWRAEGTNFQMILSPALQQDLDLLGVASEFSDEEIN